MGNAGPRAPREGRRRRASRGAGATDGSDLASPNRPPTRQRMAAQAARDATRVCTPLASLSAEAVRREASRHTRQSSAPGIAGGTAAAYAAHRDEHRRDLPARLRRGRSQAAPVARVWIAQDDGSPRPIGPPACEEKSVQRARAMRRAASDEPAGLAGSEGLRPGRSPQAARHECRERGMQEGRERGGRGAWRLREP